MSSKQNKTIISHFGETEPKIVYRLMFIFFITAFYSPFIYSQVTKVKSTLPIPHPKNELLFGHEIDVYEQNAIIGCWTGEAPVYVYKKNINENWEFVQELVPSKLERHSWFGRNLIVNENFAVISAEQESGGGNKDIGAVYIFKKITENRWIEHQKLSGLDYKNVKDFGLAIAFDGNSLIITYRKYEKTKFITQTVNIYEQKSDGKWKLDQELVSDNGSFGSSIDVLDGVLLIGSFAAIKDGKTSHGKAYIYEKDSDLVWREKLEICSLVDDSRFFGHRVKLTNNHAIISTESHNAIQILTRNNLMWSQGYKTNIIKLPKYVKDYAFDIDLNKFIVCLDRSFDTPNSVRVYEYKNDKNWSLIDEVVSAEKTVLHHFGRTLAIHGNNILIGAHYSDSPIFKHIGKVYSFNLD